MRATSDEMSTIEPPPPAAISGAEYLIAMNDVSAFFNRSATNVSSLIARNGTMVPPPTVATVMFRPPVGFVASSSAPRTSSTRWASPTKYCTLVPAGLSVSSSAACSCSDDSVRPISVTEQPSRSSHRADAPPMPPAPPVTSAAIPSSAPMCVPPVSSRRNRHLGDAT